MITSVFLLVCLHYVGIFFICTFLFHFYRVILRVVYLRPSQTSLMEFFQKKAQGV